MRLRPAVVVTVSLLALLAACGSSRESAGSSPSVAVKATDTACELATTSLPSGMTHFAVTNAGNRITEVYVYGQQGDTFSKIVGEVENLGPGTSRGFDVTLEAGTYEVACKPGMTGPGIRTRVVVAGAAATASGGATTGTDPREAAVEASDTAISGVDGFTAKAGETVRFSFANKGTGPREMGLLGPDGTLLAEAEAAAGATGEATVTFPKAGTYTIAVHPEGKDDQALKHPFEVS